ncbi:hypothetical protein Pcinc_018972 [Petrolisthes cinctipes]|uniref:Rap1 GTPase-GDP dissociation stimulator 1 n=1 Tax=Petrolisthes cinctipes TaxID=88211 RepID=A0AAE1FM52_PETCI|nr:hypothetical protein Pcinc_018972 [Petrolisthes cinctipes]
MEELTAGLEKLRLASSDPNPDLFDQLLRQVNALGGDEKNTGCESLVSGGILPLCLAALQSSSPDTQARSAELVAELAKVESCRVGCVDSGVVGGLVSGLGSTDTNVALQACRALGNICYEHVCVAEGGRVSVVGAGGAGKLVGLLSRAASLPDTPDNHHLRLVSTGFLLNLLNSYDTVQDDALEATLVGVLCEYLDKYSDDPDIPTHVLLSLTCLADTEVGRGLVVSRDITPQLVRVLKVNQSPEVIETALELVSNLADNAEDVKTQMAEGGVCQAVMEVVRRHRESPSPDLSPPILKTATDLIVLILVGDESMNTLYGGGKGPVYVELLDWLNADLEDLQIAGALAMGNFARSDAHCIQMVERGIAGQLLGVLAGHNSGEGDIRLQHALLSALRNLSIARQNKPVLVEQGALTVLLPMATKIETFPVVFKLLATLRMIIDGQVDAALKVGSEIGVVERLVVWTGTTDHPGVQGESSRLLAWIIKNSSASGAQTSEVKEGEAKGAETEKPDKEKLSKLAESGGKVVSALVAAGCVAPLVAMLGSEHAVMVNEAAVALAVVAGTDAGREAAAATPLLKTVAPQVLRNTYLPPEILVNTLTFLTTLATHEKARESMKTDEMREGVAVLSSHASDHVKSLAQDLKAKL